MGARDPVYAPPARAELYDQAEHLRDAYQIEVKPLGVSGVTAADRLVEIARVGASFLVVADAICMATHGRSGVARLVMGSQAEEVVPRSRQPVGLVPAEEVNV